MKRPVSRNLSRRSFLGTSATTALAATIVMPRRAAWRLLAAFLFACPCYGAADKIRRIDRDSSGSVADRLAERTPAVALGWGGGLKMFYDNRMYPQAVALGESVYVVWRGQEGYPYLATYDLNRRRRGKAIMLLDGFADWDEIKPSKYRKDHHYAPVIWSDQEQHLHVLFGCHKTPGIHLISKQPRCTQAWVRGPPFSESVSYPRIHRIADDKTLVYYRESGHLGRWQYRISDDGGRSWPQPPRTVVDLDAQPQDAPHAACAGSYNTTAVSADGKRLHVAFFCKVEEPVFNRRYDRFLDDHTQRYNLYNLVIDLASGSALNIHGRVLELPLRKKSADDQCLVWDTDERVAAVGPSIVLDGEDRPHFLLPVSDKTPHESRFHHVSFDHGTWQKTPITETLHPFNAGYLEIDDQGVLKAYLIAGSGHEIVEEGMDEYGWGQRVEQWESRDGGNHWILRRNLSPVDHQRYQSIQFVSRDMRTAVRDLILFYGWSDRNGPGTAYLWDGRRP